MKITVWMRNGSDGKPTLRVDSKYENLDSPAIQRMGLKLMEALEGMGDGD